MPLTEVFIRAQKPAEKAIKHFDGGGLFLEVTPKGGRYWRLKYRWPSDQRNNIYLKYDERRDRNPRGLEE